MQEFQKQVGSKISYSQEFISKDEILRVTKELIAKEGNIYESRGDFLEKFPYSQSVILNRYGSFDNYIKETKIIIKNVKKAKYSKREVDNMILSFLKDGNKIPNSAKKLSELKLPSSSTMLRFYEDWKEPFIIFSKMIDITNK